MISNGQVKMGPGTLYGSIKRMLEADLIEEAEKGRRFRARRIEIIHGIAQQAALAIQNDLLQQEMVVRERLETEVQLARQIQQTFIPQSLPTHESWQFAARWRTARQVGGSIGVAILVVILGARVSSSADEALGHYHALWYYGALMATLSGAVGSLLGKPAVAPQADRRSERPAVAGELA